MRVMTYNIYDGAAETFELVVKAIRIANPDVLILNEANGFQKNNFERLKTLAERVKMPYFHLELCGDGDEYHVVVLAKQPFKSVQALRPFARAAILVTFSSSIGDVAIIGAHLSPRYEATRLQEVDEITRELKPYMNKLVIGDLNSLSAADRYPVDLFDHLNEGQRRKFTEDGKVVFKVMEHLGIAGFIDLAIKFGQQQTITVPTPVSTDIEHSSLRLDYILVSGPIANRAVKYDVLKDATTAAASDHYPVITDFDIQLLAG